MARTMAGLIADLAGWRAVYASSTLASFAMATLAWMLLPNDQRRERPHSYHAAVASLAILSADEPRVPHPFGHRLSCSLPSACSGAASRYP